MSAAIIAALLVRLGLVVLFMPFSALDKLLGFDHAAQRAQQVFKPRPLAVTVLLTGLFIEIVFTLGVLSGVADRACAFVIVGYYAATAVLYKQFWPAVLDTTLREHPMSDIGPKPHVPYWHLYVDEGGVSRQVQCALSDLDGPVDTNPGAHGRFDGRLLSTVSAADPKTLKGCPCRIARPCCRRGRRCGLRSEAGRRSEWRKPATTGFRLMSASGLPRRVQAQNTSRLAGSPPLLTRCSKRAPKTWAGFKNYDAIGFNSSAIIPVGILLNAVLGEIVRRVTLAA